MITGWRLISAAVALAWAGCAAVPPERPVIESIGKHLDKEGIEFSVTAASAWRMSSDYVDRIIEKTLWKGDLVDTEQLKLMFYVSTWHLLRDLSGLEHAGGSGHSTTVISGERCHSRGFLALEPSAPGLINELPAAENRIDVSGFISGLPAGYYIAAAADLRPEALLTALSRSGMYQDAFAGAFPSGFPLPELLKNCAGIWEIILLGEGEDLFKIEFPDPSAKVFNFCRLAAMGPGGKNQLSRIKLGNGAIVSHHQGRTAYYATGDVEKVFRSSVSFQPGKEREFLFYRQPEKAVAVMIANAGESVSCTAIGELNILYPDCEAPEIITVTREKEGFLLRSNQIGAWQLQDGLLALDFAELLGKIKFPRAKQQDAGEAEEAGENAGESEAAENEENISCRCEQILPEAAGMLKEKPDMAAGKYEVSPELSVFYFGRIESAVPVPSFILMPHGNSFCILFSDGKIEKFELSGNCNFRRIIAFLQTVKKYDEKVFRHLIKLAAVFDYQEERN